MKKKINVCYIDDRIDNMLSRYIDGYCEELSLAFEHQGNMDDWLIIDKIEDVVVGTSIPYNYDNSRFK